MTKWILTVGPRCPLGPGLPGVPWNKTKWRAVSVVMGWDRSRWTCNGACCTQTTPKISCSHLPWKGQQQVYSWLLILHLFSFIMLGQAWMVIPMPRQHLPSEERNLLIKSIASPFKHHKDFQRWGHPLDFAVSWNTSRKTPHLCFPKPKISFPTDFCWSLRSAPNAGAGQAGSHRRTHPLQDLYC